MLVPQVVPTAASVPQGSRDFYIRAERASLPLHAPDMLAVRIQVIDGARTSTLQDPQPCRLLPLAAENDVTATDYGQATSDMSKFQILSQTGIAALSQANQSQQLITKLLQ